MMRKLLLMALSAGLSLLSFAQTEIIPCYTHEAYLINCALYPGYKEAVDKVSLRAQSYGSKTLAKKGGFKDDTIFRIPVVFHVLYNNALENIDDSLIHSQIKILNDHFNRRHEDTSDTRDIFKPVAASCRIEFYLATHDPDSNPTTGILRRSTAVTSYIQSFQSYLSQADNIKKSSGGGDDAWDPERYMNIWSGDISNNGSVFLLGYAYPPADLDNWSPGNSAPLKALEGVVLHYYTVGKGNPANPVSRGMTAVHEVGHYLGLRHIWADDPDCSVDDYIEDTPNMGSNSQSSNGTCRLSKNSCGAGVPGDLPDMIENYMDYSPEQCQNMFTAQQSNFMRNVLRFNRPDLAQITIVKAPAPPPPVVYAKPFNFKLKPNPAGAEMIIEFEGVQENDVKIQIMDITGRQVLEIKLEKGLSQYTLELSPLSNGMYYIQTLGEKTSKAVKFVKAEGI